MQLLYELKDNSELNDEKSRLRLEEYAELAHLHCIIAALPDERAKWFDHQNNRKVELEKSWTKLARIWVAGVFLSYRQKNDMKK